jgi:hypothetical protein
MRILLKGVALLAVAFPAWADRVTLTNGYTVEGKASEAGGVLRVELKRGWVEFPRDRVAKVEPAPTPWEVYADRVKGLASEDVPGQLAMARWCLEVSLPEEARCHHALAMAADPDCEEARFALGFRKEEGAWVREAPRQPDPPRVVETAESGDDDEEEGRPLERFFSGSLPSRTRRVPVSSYACYAYGAGGYYPVRPGSVWTFPWGTVYGSPLLLCPATPGFRGPECP